MWFYQIGVLGVLFFSLTRTFSAHGGDQGGTGGSLDEALAAREMMVGVVLPSLMAVPQTQDSSALSSVPIPDSQGIQIESQTSIRSLEGAPNFKGGRVSVAPFPPPPSGEDASGAGITRRLSVPLPDSNPASAVGNPLLPSQMNPLTPPFSDKVTVKDSPAPRLLERQISVASYPSGRMV